MRSLRRWQGQLLRGSVTDNAFTKQNSTCKSGGLAAFVIDKFLFVGEDFCFLSVDGAYHFPLRQGENGQLFSFRKRKKLQKRSAQACRLSAVSYGEKRPQALRGRPRKLRTVRLAQDRCAAYGSVGGFDLTAASRIRAGCLSLIAHSPNS